MPSEPRLLFELVGFGIFFWLGVYLSVRAPRRSPLIAVSVTALFAQAVFFAASVLRDTTADAAALSALEHATWWSRALPLALWFHFSRLVARSDRADVPVWHEALLILFYLAGGAISLLGAVTDWFLMVVVRDGAAAVAPGPAYPAHIAYVLLVMLGVQINFARSVRRARRRSGAPAQISLVQLRLLEGGGWAFLAGALWLALIYFLRLGLPDSPGYLAMLVGLAAVGYAVAHYGLLLEGQRIERDFLYNLTGIAAVALLYLGLLIAAGVRSSPALLTLIALVALSHTGLDAGRRLLDRLFFSKAEQDARAEARDYAVALATAPVELPAPEPPADAAPAPADAPLPAKEFKDSMRRAISALRTPPRLAQSDLLASEVVELRVRQAAQEDNRLNRIAALRELLIAQIEGLRPLGHGDLPATSDPWRFYNVLYYPYVRGITRAAALDEVRRLADERRRQGQTAPGELEQVLVWLADLDERTYHNWQRRASDMIAENVWQDLLRRKRADAPQQAAPSSPGADRNFV